MMIHGVLTRRGRLCFGLVESAAARDRWKNEVNFMNKAFLRRADGESMTWPKKEGWDMQVMTSGWTKQFRIAER